MKFLNYGKDGGPESHVWGFWFIEIKSLFSVALLHFKHGSREAYHSHAFNCISWVLWGGLSESHIDSPDSSWFHWPRFKPVCTYRDTFHRVHSIGDTWVLTFRGHWAKTWQEYLPKTGDTITLTNGREVINDR